MRRSEDGTRAWAAEVGEYYMGFTGEYGGFVILGIAFFTKLRALFDASGGASVGFSYASIFVFPEFSIVSITIVTVLIKKARREFTCRAFLFLEGPILLQKRTLVGKRFN